MQIELLFHEGCPNLEKVRKILLRLKVDFKEIRQEDLPHSDPRRSLSSPTILKAGKPVWGTTVSGGGCTFENIDTEEIRKRIQGEQ